MIRFGKKDARAEDRSLSGASQEMMRQIKKADSIAMSGHIRPDGDCIGACLGLCTYIKVLYPEKKVDVFLESLPPEYHFLENADAVLQEKDDGMVYDLYFALDCSDPERMNAFQSYFEEAKAQICIDHHVTNKGFGDLCVVRPEASSTCEILCDLLDCEKITKGAAEALYMGIAHDTGVFKHTNTTRKVMETAGALLDKGVVPEKILEETFYKKTYLQIQILGRALIESICLLEGRMIFSSLSEKTLRFYNVNSNDLEGIVSQLKSTEGVEVAMFMYEIDPDTWKVSLRSTDKVDVSRIAASFGGGGHKKAAGCTAYGKRRDVVTNIARLVSGQLDGAQEV